MRNEINLSSFLELIKLISFSMFYWNNRYAFLMCNGTFWTGNLFVSRWIIVNNVTVKLHYVRQLFVSCLLFAFSVSDRTELSHRLLEATGNWRNGLITTFHLICSNSPRNTQKRRTQLLAGSSSRNRSKATTRASSSSSVSWAPPSKPL